MEPVRQAPLTCLPRSIRARHLLRSERQSASNLTITFCFARASGPGLDETAWRRTIFNINRKQLPILTLQVSSSAANLICSCGRASCSTNTSATRSAAKHHAPEHGTPGWITCENSEFTKAQPCYIVHALADRRQRELSSVCSVRLSPRRLQNNRALRSDTKPTTAGTWSVTWIVKHIT